MTSQLPSVTSAQEISAAPIMPSPWGRFAAIWGLLGFSCLLGEAFYKVIPYVLELFQSSLSLFHWSALVGWVAFMAYSEGYRGFQQHYSPRFAARLRWLRDHANVKQALLAPLFCMCFFGTTRKRKIVAYSLTSGIMLLVFAIKFLAQPWRGIIDVGVIIGLGWGLLSIYVYAWQALALNREISDPEVVV